MSATEHESYCTHVDYTPNAQPQHFDDTANTDEWQNEVYALAQIEFSKRQYRRIVDVGCGSAFKLVKYFPPHATVGFEIEPALSYVKARYPNRTWRGGTELRPALHDADMIICSDVIEHLDDPADLLDAFAQSPSELFVVSTPALEVVVELGWSTRLGPPGNVSHIREWTTVEFARFVSRHLKIISHQITSVSQGTQTVIATKL